MKIVVRQISGLGNQLFQYAAGMYYAKRFGGPMRLAIDPPQKAHSYGSPRPFLLPNFSITAPYAVVTQQERLLLSEKRSLQPVLTAYCRLLGVEVLREQLEQRYTFVGDPPVRSDASTLYVAGYWQSHEMVDHVALEVREQFRFARPPEGRSAEVLRQICNTEDAVSLHVRRGDYTLAAEGQIALPMEFYERAIEHFRERLKNPVFFVFSDDIAYTRANLPTDIRAVFVDHNDDATAHDDMRLMSSCQHHILANSSFSWWGAWLNPSKTKIVFAPKYWHLTAESYFPGLCPPEWVLGEFEVRAGTRQVTGGR